jgi:hypothetical protein
MLIAIKAHLAARVRMPTDAEIFLADVDRTLAEMA